MIFFNQSLFAFLFIFLSPSFCFAQAGDSAVYPVRVRDARHQIVIENRPIADLLKEGLAETPRFKVVYQQGSEAVALDSTMDGQRAATLLYHFEFAYEKMKKRVGPKILASLGQIVIRLETANQFSETVHFVNEDLNPMFNNITTIPASNTERLEKYAAWGNEIWIRPSKLVSEPTGMAAFTDQSKQVRDVMIEGTVTSVTTQYAQFSAAYNRFLSPGMHLEQLAVGLAISYGLPELLGWVGKNAHEKRQFDAAMVPEVLYHEFAHLAFSHWLPIGMSTPVLEGYANFIAIDLSGLDEVAGHLGEYGKNFKATQGKGKARYQLLHESLNYAWEDFTPKLLIAVRNTLGEELGNRVLMESIRVLALSKKPVEQLNIRYDLCSAIKEAVRKLSPADELQLNLLKVNNVYADFKLIRRSE